MRVFITGIAGFLGSHLGDALLNTGHEVCGNDNYLCSEDNNYGHSTFWLDCRNFTDPLALRHLRDFSPDVLVHCAATAAEGFSLFSPSFITKNIYDASVATFSAAIAAGIKRIVFMSSMARYGNGDPSESAIKWSDGKVPFKEYYTPSPIDPYGIAKVAAEETLKVLCETHGVKWSICVPHNIVGTRQEVTPYRNVVSIFLNRLKLGLPVYIYGDGEQKRCFSPIKDCLHSLTRIVNGDADGEVVNIGPDGGEITINELLNICENITGITANRVYLPPRPVTDTVKNAYCSSDKARRLLGYEPQQSLYDCIKEMSDTMVPKPFNYSFPIEIESEKCPRPWAEKL